MSDNSRPTEDMEHTRRLQWDDDYRNWFDYFLTPGADMLFDEWMAAQQERHKMRTRCRFGIEPREIKL